jgi:predicted phosphodiesterase
MEMSGGRTGLIADSHGSTSTLVKAINTLSQKKCLDLIHLGDFLDSVDTGRINEVLLILQQYRVRTVKGNNDYQVEKMIANGNFSDLPDPEMCRAFLKATPIFHSSGKTCFSHSLPYDSIRSFYEPIDNGTIEKAAAVFKKTSYHILFCGHSHKPVFFRYNAGIVTREAIITGRPVGIRRHERYIFIVGSAESGECGIYNREESQYERIEFT